MRKLVFTILFLVLAAGYSKAQLAGINFQLGAPQGEFKENLDRLAWGFSGHFGLFRPTPQMPFTIGLNIGFMNYGNESRNTPISYTIPDVTVNVDRSNNLFNFHALFQLVPLPNMQFTPYLEGLFGGAYFWTETKITSERSSTEEIASSVNWSDWAWSYGFGGGFLIRIYTQRIEKKISSTYWLDLKVRYLYGSNASYLTEGGVQIYPNGTVAYHPAKSKTDMISFHLGIVAMLNY